MSDVQSGKRGLPSRVKMRHQSHFVEDLAVGESTPVGKMVPLAEIQPDPKQPRSAMGNLAPLVESIRTKGVLEPILVRPLPEGLAPESYRIVSGERRFRAASEAGLLEIPVIELDVGEDEALEIALVENLQRKDLTPFEEGEGFRILADHHGYTHQEIAEAVCKSRSVVTETIGLLQIPPRVRDAIEALGIQSKTALREIAKAPNEDAMIHLAEVAAERGLSRDDLRQISRRDAQRGRAQRAQPYSFRFRAPDKSYKLALTFKKSTVERQDLITALEEILRDLRSRDEG